MTGTLATIRTGPSDREDGRDGRIGAACSAGEVSAGEVMHTPDDSAGQSDLPAPTPREVEDHEDGHRRVDESELADEHSGRDEAPDRPASLAVHRPTGRTSCRSYLAVVVAGVIDVRALRNRRLSEARTGLARSV